MVKEVAILLNGSIKNDSRVIKTIKTISEKHFVDLFYVNAGKGDNLIFGENVKLIPCANKVSLKRKIIKHTCFYNEYLFFVDKVLEQKRNYDFVWSNDLPCLKPGVILKKKLDAKLVYDSHEIYNETINQFFPQKSTGLKKVLFSFMIKNMRFWGKIAERKYVKKVDTFITVGNELKKYFEKEYGLDNIKVIMNCPSLETKFTALNLKNKLGIKQTDKLFIYQGVLNAGRGLNLLIKSFSRVNEGIYLFILGAGTLKKVLTENA